MRRVLAFSGLVVGWVALAPSAQAIPAFARRYGVECHFCHEGYPKLNNMGKRFKERGFRMANEDPFDASKWIRSVPVAVRGWANQLLVEDFDDASSGYLKAISAGNLGKRVSYWADDAMLITEGDDNFTHIKPTNAWLRIDIVSDEKLYLKGGRLELDLPFTQIRTPHLFSYDVYQATTGFESDNIGGYQDGVEIGGALPREWRWSAAVVKGRNDRTAEAFTDEASKFDANVFLRGSKRVNRNRFGGFAYIGRNTLARSAAVVWKNSFQRYGLDADVWLGKLNLYGVYMHGRDSNPYASAARPTGTNIAQTFDGGFLQADYHLLTRLILTARFNAVSEPSDPVTGSAKKTSSNFFPGVQFFFFERGKLSFEYGFLNQDRRSYGAIQAEFAF